MDPLAIITCLGGNTPVQGEGTLPDGKAFYFRARHEAWTFSVGATPDEAVDGDGWSWSEPYGDQIADAGYMPEDEAGAIIESCAEMYAAHVTPPVEDAGLSAAERDARRLGRRLRCDLLYNAYLPESGVLSPAALTSMLAEARAAFDEHVATDLHHVLDEELGDLDALARRAVAHPRWLHDAASARSVGARWNAMLRRLPTARRAEVSLRGERWLTRWTVDGAPREALLRTLRETPPAP